MGKKSCVDEYGNPEDGLKVGAVVESDVAIFTVGEINSKTEDWFVFMDKNKPYIIKDESHPMAKCVRSGHYGVIAPCLVFSEFPPPILIRKNEDLISRENLKKAVDDYIEQHSIGDGIEYAGWYWLLKKDTVIKIINSQPAAFDVDKVVKRLEEKAEQYSDPVSSDTRFRRYCEGISAGYRYAVDIVKAGGKDE